jgi:hypothetical protein
MGLQVLLALTVQHVPLALTEAQEQLGLRVQLVLMEVLVLLVQQALQVLMVVQEQLDQLEQLV